MIFSVFVHLVELHLDVMDADCYVTDSENILPR